MIALAGEGVGDCFVSMIALGLPSGCVNGYFGLKLVIASLHAPPSADSTTLLFVSIGWIFIDLWPCF